MELKKLELPSRTGSAEPPFLVLYAMHGIGNRLRSVASAMAFAKVLGRQFALVWKPDIHCGAHFSINF